LKFLSLISVSKIFLNIEILINTQFDGIIDGNCKNWWRRANNFLGYVCVPNFIFVCCSNAEI